MENNYSAELDIVQRVQRDLTEARKGLEKVNFESFGKDNVMPFSTYLALDNVKDLFLMREYFKEYVVVGRIKQHPKKLTFEQWLLTKNGV